MKKVVLVAAVAMLSLASCKKDHTCVCTVSTTTNGTTTTLSNETTLKDMSTSDAKKSCNISAEVTIGNTVQKNECSLK